jgi:hypothetical protein
MLDRKCQELNSEMHKGLRVREYGYVSKPRRVDGVKIVYKYTRYYIYYNRCQYGDVYTKDMLSKCKPNEIYVTYCRFADHKGYCQGYTRYINGTRKFTQVEYCKCLDMTYKNISEMIKGMSYDYVIIYNNIPIELDKILTQLELYVSLRKSMRMAYSMYVKELCRQQRDKTNVVKNSKIVKESTIDETRSKLFKQEQFFVFLQGRYCETSLVRVLDNDVMSIILSFLIV